MTVLEISLPAEWTSHVITQYVKPLQLDANGCNTGKDNDIMQYGMRSVPAQGRLDQ